MSEQGVCGFNGWEGAGWSVGDAKKVEARKASRLPSLSLHTERQRPELSVANRLHAGELRLSLPGDNDEFAVARKLLVLESKELASRAAARQAGNATSSAIVARNESRVEGSHVIGYPAPHVNVKKTGLEQSLLPA